MQWRHELKHEISPLDMVTLRQRLGAVMAPDCHAQNGRYSIRSLYFDSLDDRALREKLDGVAVREKYRLRLYNGDASVIHLERKFKCGQLGYKELAVLTADQARRIAAGDIGWMAASPDPVVLGFYAKLRAEGLAAKVIVDYTRIPFVYGPGNVRVTLDYDIRTALRCTDFLNPGCATVPVPGSPCILEVKWDGFLPDVIRGIVQLGDRHSAAYSKYAACRTYD